MKNWIAVGQVRIVDFNNDGILQLSEWFMNEDVVVLATPEIAGLPYVISGLVAAGGLAAAMSTADGLILAMANAISHDVYYKMINPKASVQTKINRCSCSFSCTWVSCCHYGIIQTYRYLRSRCVGV